MPEQENVGLVREFVGKVLNDGDMDALSGMVHNDIVLPGSTPGLDGLRRTLLDQRKVFADPEYKAVDVIAQGEKVAVRFAGKATHDAAFLGLPATGKRLKIWGVMIFRFEGRMIAEFWSVLDVSSILGQLRDR
jgi:predicted ester cyclase